MDENKISIVISTGTEEKLIMLGVLAQTAANLGMAMSVFVTGTALKMFMKDGYREEPVVPEGFENFMHKLRGGLEKVKYPGWHSLLETANGNCFTTGTDMYQNLVSHGYITGMVSYYGEFTLKFSNGISYTDSSYYGTSNTPIQNIGSELGTAMYTLFAGKNVNVDIFAYSMGGLVTLYSLENYKIPGMNLQHVIFLATPFDGSSLASVAQYLGISLVTGYQTTQMSQGSSFLSSLDGNTYLAVSNYPATTWIVYDGNYNPWWGYLFFSGSNDGVVSDNSATYLGYNYLYTFSDLHTASLDSFTWSGQSYFQDQSVLNTALNNFGGSY